MSQKPLLIQTGSRDHVEVSGFGLNFRQYFSFQVSYNTLEAISKFLRQELVDVKLVRLYSTV